MGEDREGHPVWYDNFNYDFKGIYMYETASVAVCIH